MRQGINIYVERKFLRGLWEQLIMYTFREIFIRQGILLGHLICDLVQGVERLFAQPFTSLVGYPLGDEHCNSKQLATRKSRKTRATAEKENLSNSQPVIQNKQGSKIYGTSRENNRNVHEMWFFRVVIPWVP